MPLAGKVVFSTQHMARIKDIVGLALCVVAVAHAFQGTGTVTGGLKYKLVCGC